jgi:pimeloyl-ACP methyl ester carboxylesterase
MGLDGAAGAAADDGGAIEGALPLANDLPEVCKNPEVMRIDRPVTKDKSVPGTFSYGFRFKPAASEGGPVLVDLPGGPGQGSIADPPDYLPEGWGYLMTDPRGVGCNRLATLPSGDLSSAFFRTEELAADVIAAIESRHLTSYVLFGTSYGTLLGTTIAHHIEALSGPVPKAVVFQGVLGKAFGDTFIAEEQINQWNRVHDALPADVMTELDTKESPFGVGPDGWAHAIGGLLTRSPETLSTLLGQLSSAQAEAMRQAALDQIKQASQDEPQPPAENELYRQIACREICDTVPSGQRDVIFRQGRLVRNSTEEGTLCMGLKVTTPFDAAKLQFMAKVYDFVGEYDVATPAWQGAYHFMSHQGSAVRVLVKAGGHNPLTFNEQPVRPRADRRRLSAEGRNRDEMTAR